MKSFPGRYYPSDAKSEDSVSRNDGRLGVWMRAFRCRILTSPSRWTLHVNDRHLQALIRPRRRCGVDAGCRCAATTLRTSGEQCGAAGLSGLWTAAAAEQIAVVVAAKLAAEEVQRQRVDARVDERQTIGNDLEDVPEHVVLGRIKVVPEIPDVTRQPAHNEDDDKRQHQTSYLLTSFHLQQQQ